MVLRGPEHLHGLAWGGILARNFKPRKKIKTLTKRKLPRELIGRNNTIGPDFNCPSFPISGNSAVIKKSVSNSERGEDLPAQKLDSYLTYEAGEYLRRFGTSFIYDDGLDGIAGTHEGN